MVLTLDANGKTGYIKGEGVHQLPPHDDAIGTCTPEMANVNGELLRGFLNRNRLFAVNTHCDEGSGPTYRHHDGGSSRLDYVGLPKGYHDAVLKCEVLLQAGRRAGQAPGRPAVHRPAGRRPAVPVNRGPPNGVVTTPCGESVGTRGHRTVLGAGSFSEDVSGDWGLRGPKTVR